MFDSKLRDLLQMIEERWGKFGKWVAQAIFVLVMIAFVATLWRIIFQSTRAAPGVIGDCSGNTNNGSGPQTNDCSTHIESNHQRHLTGDQSAALTAAARGACGQLSIEVTAAISNNEAQVYAMDFVHGFQAAGCRADLALPTPGLRPDIVGVQIGIRPDMPRPENLQERNSGAYFLSAALEGAKVRYNFGLMEADFFPTTSFVLVVGAIESK